MTDEAELHLVQQLIARERLSLDVAMTEAGYARSELSVISSPLHELRQVFEPEDFAGTMTDEERAPDKRYQRKLTEIIQLKGANGEKAQAWVIFGEVVAVHIDKAMIQDGVYQTALARPIVRAGRRGDYFEIRPENMFEMIRPD